MEAILDMSMLTGRKIFEQAALPPTQQLKLHVDAEMFSRLVVRDVLFGGAREILGKAIHESNTEKTKKTSSPPMIRLCSSGRHFRRTSENQTVNKLMIFRRSFGVLDAASRQSLVANRSRSSSNQTR